MLARLGRNQFWPKLSPRDQWNVAHLRCTVKIVGARLPRWSPLTHGYHYNISGHLFDGYSYSVSRETGSVDLDELRKRVHEVKPLILLAGYSAYPRKLNFAKMRGIADEVGAVFMVDMAHFAGLVTGKVFTQRGLRSRAARSRRHVRPHTDPTRTRAMKSIVLILEGVRRTRRQGLPSNFGRAIASRHGRQGGCVPRGFPAELLQNFTRRRSSKTRALSAAACICPRDARADSKLRTTTCC